MEVKKFTLRTIGLILMTVLIVGGFWILIANKPTNSNDPAADASTVNLVDGTQFIDMTAKAGFTPRLIQAEANIPTTLRVNTKNTFDCSASLVIPSKRIRNSLPATGVTEINLGIQTAGSEINGTCAMGMYSFKIKFI